MFLRFLSLSIGLIPLASAGCPFLAAKQNKAPPAEEVQDVEDISAYHRALADIDFSAVQVDLVSLFHTSQEWWPSDFDNYGPFFVRLAWHCSGSYRQSDGRGGCSGGRQRFEPEESW